MKYMGSKARIAKYILPIMLEEAAKNGITTWVEPFVGGGNMIDKVPDTFKRIGYDNNINVINALNYIKYSIDEIPKDNTEFTESDYNSYIQDDGLRAFSGFAYSYSGKWRGGWCRDGANKRDYVAEAYKNALKQHPLIQNVTFNLSSYDRIVFDEKSLIYCDPPYESTTKYVTGGFNHSNFWKWVRKQSSDGHLVFVSEYNAPEDFEVIWEKEQVSSLTQNTGAKKAIEKLFKLK